MISYVKLDPTGNLTCLVTRKPPEADEAAITKALMRECEQVAYLEPPTRPGSRARIRLMGGEFCGNAALASACWLAREDGILLEEERVIPLEVSGAEGVLACTVRRTKAGFEGTAPMPKMERLWLLQEEGYALTAMRMEGIAHLMLEDEPELKKELAENLLRQLAANLPDEAVGLLQWNRHRSAMIPLVWVRGSGTMVWETGCGSGSAAVGAREAMRGGDGIHEIEVWQPGGMIRVKAEVKNGWAENVSITGRVKIGEELQKEIG